MTRLLKLLFVTTLLLFPIMGLVAVLAGFGDPWGMGSKSPAGVFVTAALPILPPGLYHLVAWPLTFGVALLMSLLVLLHRPRAYLVAVLAYLIALSLGWLLGWTLDPELLNRVLDGQTYVAGRLNRGVWKLGVYLLVDAALLAGALAWWFRTRARV